MSTFRLYLRSISSELRVGRFLFVNLSQMKFWQGTSLNDCIDYNYSSDTNQLNYPQYSVDSSIEDHVSKLRMIGVSFTLHKKMANYQIRQGLLANLLSLIQMVERSRADPILRVQQFSRKQIVKNHPLQEEQPQSRQREPKKSYQDFKEYKNHMNKNDYERESEPCYQKRYFQGPGSSNIQSSPQSPKQSLYNFPSQMMRILMEENNNLKEQNKFLQGKLKELSSKECELVQTVLQYQTIMAALNAQNQQLQKQVLYFSERANNKVDKLGKQLGKLLTKKQHVRQREEDGHVEESQSNTDHRQKYIQMRDPAFQPNSFKRIRSQERMLNGRCFTNDPELAQSVQHINSEFEALLYACRMEVNPEKRKQLRRRLVSLTYKKNPMSP